MTVPRARTAAAASTRGGDDAARRQPVRLSSHDGAGEASPPPPPRSGDAAALQANAGGELGWSRRVPSSTGGFGPAKVVEWATERGAATARAGELRSSRAERLPLLPLLTVSAQSTLAAGLGAVAPARGGSAEWNERWALGEGSSALEPAVVLPMSAASTVLARRTDAALTRAVYAPLARDALPPGSLHGVRDIVPGGKIFELTVTPVLPGARRPAHLPVGGGQGGPSPRSGRHIVHG